MDELQILKDTASKMLIAYDEAVKARTSQSKWAVFNGYRYKLKELIDPKQKAVSQATIEWLAQ